MPCKLVVILALLAGLVSTAEAKPRHEASIGFSGCTYDNNGRTVCGTITETRPMGRRPVIQSGGYETAQMLPHPSGCPSTRFCGCGAAVRVFGSAIRSLWPSAAWFKFPRSAPASGMVAVRYGHVFVLESHVSGNEWLISDYNSGGHLSRRHVRSISGYTIVNPHGAA